MDIYFLFALLVVASVWDFKTHKIPNALSIIGAASGIIFLTFANGLDGLKTSIFSILISFILLFVIWSILEVCKLSIFGAGDMKLMIAISAFLGIKEMFQVFYLSIIFGGIVFVFLIPWKQTVQLFKRSLFFLYYAFPLKKEKQTARLAFSFPILIACIFSQYFL